MKNRACFWAALLVLVPGLVRADVLTESIPADAKVVVVANDLTRLEAGVKALSSAPGWSCLRWPT